MKFDVVVGNPPYQNIDTNGKKNTSFYLTFLRQAKKIGKLVAFVVPKNYLFFKNQRKGLTIVSLTDDAHFDISIDTCWFIFEKDSNVPTKQLTLSGLKVIDWAEFDRFEVSLDDVTSSVIRKIKTPSNFGTIDTGRLEHHLIEENPKGVVCITSVVSKSGGLTTKLVDEKQMTQLGGFGSHKIVFNIQTTPSSLGVMKYSDPTQGTSAKVYFYQFNSKEECENCISFLNSKIVKFLIPKLKAGSKFNTRNRVLSNIPVIDFTRSWTDEELYDHFGLTEEEIRYIEETVK